MTFSVVIPARLGSTRLPGKVLLDIAGRPLIQHVIDAARRSLADEVIVATDDRRVADAVMAVNCEVEMTSADHASGSDRILEVAESRGWPDDRVIVNVQGDEPLLPPALIDQLASALDSDRRADWATLATPISDASEYRNPNAVKLVTDQQGYALYFSRAPIPWDRDAMGELPQQGLEARRHIGLYAYRTQALRTCCQAPVAVLERTECLEQLRALWTGLRIRVLDACVPPPAGVDTPADLERVRRQLAESG